MPRERALAGTDHLTGAVNSRSFLPMVQAEIDRSRRYKRWFSLAYIDLDNFKSVNDTFGHAAGDELLRDVVRGVREQLRSSDILARLGGDEFGILLPESDRAAAETVIGKIRSSLLPRFQEREWPVTLSIGCVSLRGPDGTAEDLIKQADNLMYRTKMSGKNAAAYSTEENT